MPNRKVNKPNPDCHKCHGKGGWTYQENHGCYSNTEYERCDCWEDVIEHKTVKEIISRWREKP